MSKGKISILGCGWLGLPLAKQLINEGFSVKGSVTNPLKFELLRRSGILPFQIILSDTGVECNDLDFFDCDILIISIPPGRSSGNAVNLPLRIKKVIPFILRGVIRKVIFISSTSVYPDKRQVAREEDLALPDKESGKALLEAENLLQTESDFKTTVLRFGGLIGADRNPARFLQRAAAPVPDAPANLIHQDDCIGIISAIINQGVWGEVFNASSPEHPMKSEFYRKAAQVSGLPEPSISGVSDSYKIIDSSKLTERLNYRFVFSNPMEYLERINKTEEN